MNVYAKPYLIPTIIVIVGLLGACQSSNDETAKAIVDSGESASMVADAEDREVTIVVENSGGEEVATAVESAPAVQGKEQQQMTSSPGKPRPPISIDYKVLGTPVMGQPVEIELEVGSSIAVQSLRVSYQVIDESSLFFPDTQPRERIYTEIADRSKRSQRVTVIPQHEGRLYLNVLVEIDSENGLFTRTAAVPIQVGTVLAKPEINGELQTDEQGEMVISLPAKED